jgi:hypothetical protein
MALPAPQAAMKMMAGLDQFGSASQAGPLMPIWRSSVLMMPPSPLYMKNQSMAPATIGISDGKKNTVR